MPELGSDGWLEAVVAAGSDLPEQRGLDLVVDVEISGGPGGKLRFHVVFADGRVAHAGPGRHGEADVTLAATHADAVAMLTGALPHDVAYMQGRLKVDGAYHRWLYGFAPVRVTPAFAAAIAAVAAAADLS